MSENNSKNTVAEGSGYHEQSMNELTIIAEPMTNTAAKLPSYKQRAINSQFSTKSAYRYILTIPVLIYLILFIYPIYGLHKIFYMASCRFSRLFSKSSKFKMNNQTTPFYIDLENFSDMIIDSMDSFRNGRFPS